MTSSNIDIMAPVNRSLTAGDKVTRRRRGGTHRVAVVNISEVEDLSEDVGRNLITKDGLVTKGIFMFEKVSFDIYFSSNIFKKISLNNV